MSLVLGQVDGVKPHGFDTWEQAKSVFFAAIGYEIHAQEVLDFHKSEARVRIATAPARGAKSYTGARDAAAYGQTTTPHTDTLIWAIGPDYRTNKEFEYLYEIFVTGRERLWGAGWRYQIERETFSPNAGDMEIRFVKCRGEDGRDYRTRIMGLSASNERALQGEEVTVAIQSEAAEHPEHIYRKYLEQRCWKLILPTTPKQKAKWLKEVIDTQAGVVGTGVEAFRFPPDANPTYNWRRFEEAKRAAEIRARRRLGAGATADQDPMFAEQFLGLWVYYTGRVLPFQRELHMVPHDAIDYTGSAYALSIDYGYQDYSSAGLWAITPSGIYVRKDEVYERGLTTNDFVERCHAMLSRNRVTASFCTGDPSRPEVSQQFRESGLPVNVRSKNEQRDRVAGYRRLIDLLTEGPIEGFPGILLTDRCQKSAEEFEALHFKESHQREGDDGVRNEYSTGAIAGHDHAVDDTRYFLMSRPDGARPLPQDQARDWLAEALYALTPDAQAHYWPEGSPCRL